MWTADKQYECKSSLLFLKTTLIVATEKTEWIKLFPGIRTHGLAKYKYFANWIKSYAGVRANKRARIFDNICSMSDISKRFLFKIHKPKVKEWMSTIAIYESCTSKETRSRTREEKWSALSKEPLNRKRMFYHNVSQWHYGCNWTGIIIILENM